MINVKNAEDGINYSSVKKRYYAETWLGATTDLTKDSRFAGVVTAKMYQNSSTATNPSNFQSGISYTITSRVYLGNPQNTYIDGTSHSISGY